MSNKKTEVIIAEIAHVRLLGNGMPLRCGRRVPSHVSHVMLSDDALHLKWIIAFAIIIMACAVLSIVGLSYR